MVKQRKSNLIKELLIRISVTCYKRHLIYPTCLVSVCNGLCDAHVINIKHTHVLRHDSNSGSVVNRAASFIGVEKVNDKYNTTFILGSLGQPNGSRNRLQGRAQPSLLITG
jgi:hypothetical protein